MELCTVRLGVLKTWTNLSWSMPVIVADVHQCKNHRLLCDMNMFEGKNSPINSLDIIMYCNS